MRMVNQIVRRYAQHLFLTVANHLACSGIREGRSTIRIQSEYPIARGIQNQLS